MITLEVIETSLFGPEQRHPDPDELASFESFLRAEAAANPRESTSYRLLTEVFRRQGRAEESIVFLRAAMDAHGDERGDIQAFLGHAWGHLRQISRAIEALRQSLEINPRHLGRWYTLGYLQAKTGDLQGAKKALAEIAALEEKTGQRFQKRDLLVALAEDVSDWSIIARLGLESLAADNDNRPGQDIYRFGALEHFYGNGLEVDWYLTHRCNYRCSYCCQYADRNTPLSSSWADLVKAADAFIKMDRSSYHFFFTGGEVTLHPELGRLLYYLHEKLGSRASFGLMTNGSLGAEKLNRLLEPLLAEKDHSHLTLAMSIHTDHAKMEDIEAMVRTLSPRLPFSAVLMFHPGRRDYVRAIADRLCELRQDYFFNMIITPIVGGSPVNFDSRYSPSDYDWMVEGSERFNEIGGRSGLKAPESRPRKAATMFFDRLHQKRYQMIYAPFEELNENKFAAQRNYWLVDGEKDNPFGRKWRGLYGFKGMFCVLGTGSLTVLPDGSCRYAMCYQASELKLNSGFDDMLQEGLSPYIVKCRSDSCLCFSNQVSPKFADLKEAEICARSFEAANKRRYGGG